MAEFYNILKDEGVIPLY